MSAKPEQPEVYGLMAEFDDPGHSDRGDAARLRSRLSA